jgi:hypothetical protein
LDVAAYGHYVDMKDTPALRQVMSLPPQLLARPISFIDWCRSLTPSPPGFFVPPRALAAAVRDARLGYRRGMDPLLFHAPPGQGLMAPTSFLMEMAKFVSLDLSF